MHAIWRFGLVLVGAGLLVSFVFAVGLNCVVPRFEEMPKPPSAQAIHAAYHPLGIFLCIVGTIIVLVMTLMRDDDDS